MNLIRSRMRSVTLVAAALCAALPSRGTAQWALQHGPVRGEFRGLSVVDTNVAWVSGTRGRFGVTADGGRTWRIDSISGAGALDLRGIHAFDARTAVAFSAGEAAEGQARLYRTEDGGTTWQLTYSTDVRGAFFDALAFWDRNHGIAQSDPVNGRLLLLLTSDGGRTWREVPADALPPTLEGEAAFAASNSSVVVHGTSSAWIATGGGARARVFHTTDRGATWSVVDTPVAAGAAAAGIFAMAFRDARNGIVVGGDYTKAREGGANVAITTDGGATWTVPRGPLPQAYLSGVAWVPRAPTPTVVAVGLAGTFVSSDAGHTWVTVDTVAWNAVRFVGPRAGGWTVGPQSRIARWTGTVGLPVRKDD